MTTYWCQYAWLGGPEVAAGVTVDVAGDRITGVAPGCSAPPPTAIEVRGLTLPGIANTHSHSFQRLLRAATSGPGSFWTWQNEMYDLVARLDPDVMHRVAHATFLEMALGGVTCVGEFHYVHHRPGGEPYDDPRAMAQAVEAAADEAGVRLTLLDTCYLTGPFGAPLAPAQQRFSDGTVERWAARASTHVDTPTMRHGAAVHSVRAVGPAAIAEVAGWAAAHEVPLHAHVSEQPRENEGCVEAYGRSPVTVFAEAGALSTSFTAVHATHLTARDVAALGDARCSVALCPTTERDLGDGIADTRGLERAGCGLALGSDSHAVVDLFEEARAVESHQRLVRHERGVHDVVALAEAMTVNGYHTLGWPEGGVLAPGALADLVTLDLSSTRLAGLPTDRLLNAAVFAATASDVSRVMVGGRTVVEDRRHSVVDVPGEIDALFRGLTTWTTQTRGTS